MRKATVFKRATGEILRWGDFELDDIQLGDGEAVIDGVFTCYDYFIDIASSKPSVFPPRPSEKHLFDYAIKQWVDPRTLDDFKAEKWRNIKANREQAEWGGFTWDGSAFDSDPISQQRIAGAVQLAQISVGFTTVWTLKDNTTRTLDAQEMLSVGQALGAHVSAQFTHAQALRVDIDAATTVQQVESIHW